MDITSRRTDGDERHANEVAERLSTTDAAAMLGVSPRVIRHAIAQGELAATRHTGAYLISPDALRQFREQRLTDEPNIRPAPPWLIPLPERQPKAWEELPRPIAPMVGREHELAAIQEMLVQEELRLLTLTGPGGVGKTRLALRAAEACAAWYADGVCFVELASVRDPKLVPAVIAQALGLSNAEHESRNLLRFLRHRHLLLVLDNLEHLLPAGPLFAELLTASPQLTVLVTSREILHLSGEVVFDVRPLLLPGPDDPAIASEAVQLFVARGQAVRPGFRLTEDNASDIAEICRRLDGLPLAIELAAARISHLPPKALLARLERRLPLLTGGARDLPERQQTMQRTIAWSHDLLAPAEQALFRRLAVFDGGFDLTAAEAIANSQGDASRRDATRLTGNTSVLDAIASLVAKSILRMEEGHAGTSGEEVPRYAMLETVREFGLEELAASGEEAELRAAHADYVLALAERVARRLVGSWADLAELERERSNLHAALTWYDSSQNGDALLRLTAALGYYWQTSGHWAEAIAWQERALVADPRPSPARVEVLSTLGLLFGRRGDTARLDRLAREALSVARELGDSDQIAIALACVGSALNVQKRYAEAERCLGEAVTLARRVGNLDTEAVALTQAGIAARGRGDLIEATLRFERARSRWREQGWEDVSRRIPALHLAKTAAELGDYPRAAAEFQTFLELAADSRSALARVIPDIASMAMALGEPERAARLLGASAAVAESIGLAKREDLACLSVPVRDALGGEAFDALFAAGRRLARERLQADIQVILNLASAVEFSRSANSARDLYGLTPREREVLQLLAERLTDQEIADRLFIARRTASKHVAAILEKLGVPNRRAAGAEARRLLLDPHLYPHVAGR